MPCRCLWALLFTLSLVACAAPRSEPPLPLEALLPADALLLGEQHDVPEHQRLHQTVAQALIGSGQLAALALEMASQGRSTQALDPHASEAEVRLALDWQDRAWPWAAYGPAVMTAVRAGVPVWGANLNAAQLRRAMNDATLDQRLPAPALQAQQHAIRNGHCNLLPEGQVAPMTRVQIARDVAMADTLLTLARPGQTVLLLSGHGHANRALGVPQHLPPGFKAKTVFLQASQGQAAIKTEAEPAADFDHTWPAGVAPAVDYCADFQARLSTPAPAGTRGERP